MKKILSYIFMVLAAIAAGSCSNEKEEAAPSIGGPGLMEVEVITRGAAQEDYINTVRYVIFDDASSSRPSVSFNKTLPVKDREASSFKTVLKTTHNDDKMVVVIVNEPSSLTPKLEKITSPAGLEDVTFELADAFNADCTALLDTGNGIPMTGVIRKVSVTDENDSEQSAKPVNISIERSVARVEVWLKQEAGSNSAYVDNSTEFTLSRSHNLGYLVMGTSENRTRYQTGVDAVNNFGHMLTVGNPSATLTWQGPSAKKDIDTDAKLICVFYTPERTCNAAADADKLELNLQGIHIGADTKSGNAVLNAFVPENGTVSQPVTEILRNNAYRIVGNLKDDKIVFESTVRAWDDAPQDVIIDPQYYLKVETDNLYMPDKNSTAMVIVQTNYDPDGDRGFPKGIRLGDKIAYYGSDGSELDSGAGARYGWLTVAENGTPGSLIQDISFKVTKDPDANTAGCYAKVEIKAGNLTKIIKVVR